MLNLKTIFPLGMLTGLLFLTNQSHADCQVNRNGTYSIGSISSINLMDTGVASNQFNAGLSCTGFSLAALNMTYLKYKVSQIPGSYKNSITGEQLYVSYLDTNNNPIRIDQEVDLSSFTILNFFSGPNNSLPFYVRINAGQAVSPGIYKSEVPYKVRWYYSVPGLAVAGIGIYFESFGFFRGILGLGLNWGSGEDVSTDLSIEVLPDCRISTNDVNFGTAAFANAFEPVQTSMGIRCSAKTPYNVSLNNGSNPQNGGQRAMKSDIGNNYLNYEIYKNSSTERWGSNGIERWSSANATTNAGLYNARTQQGYAFTVKVLDTNSTHLPSGTYKDTLTVQVEF
ncbi:spore coat protein U domain-containing protein [Acinetobacter nematophilus]|uniref:Csu type fimbrial protein n=1 Tax=Acinetobacter nematophilus TaxID=2994642 RepID=UPI003AF42A45